jgi:hypothetical protein
MILIKNNNWLMTSRLPNNLIKECLFLSLKNIFEKFWIFFWLQINFLLLF